MDQAGSKGAADTILGLCLSLPVIALITVVARVYCRRKRGVALGADDWLILLASVCMIGQATCGLVGVYRGDLGRHQPLDSDGIPIRSPKLAVYQKITYAASLISTLGLTFTRLSILLFYRRIFSVKSFRIPFWVAFGLNLLWGVSFFFVYMLQCVPISQFWQTVRGQGARTCVGAAVHGSAAYSGTVLDFLVLALPIPWILKIQMPLKRKSVVLAIFLIGCTSLAASIAKSIKFAEIQSNYKKIRDTTFVLAPAFYWAIPELCIAITAACLPTLRPVFHGWSVESLVGSIGSVVSLHSSDNEGLTNGYVSSHSKSTVVLADPSAKDGPPKTTISHSTRPVEPSPPGNGTIMVDKSIGQEMGHA